MVGNTLDIITKNAKKKEYNQSYKGRKEFGCNIHKMFGNNGYIIKITKNDSTSYKLNTLRKLPTQLDTTHCEFYYNGETGKFQRIIPKSYTFRQSSKEFSAKSKEKSDVSFTNLVSSNLLGASPRNFQNYSIEQIQHHLLKRSKKYSEGIKTYQLQNGVFKRIRTKFDSKLKTVENDTKQSNCKEKDMLHEKGFDKMKFLSSRKQYQISLGSQPTPTSVKNLILVSVILLLSFIGITFCTYFVSESSLFLLRDTIGLTWKRSETYFQFCDGVYLATTLLLLSSNKITNYENCTSKDQYEQMIRDQITMSVDKTLSLATEIAALSHKFPSISQDIMTDKDVQLTLYQAPGTMNSKNYTYLETTYMITGALLKLKNTTLSEINNKNLDLMFLRDNVLNGVGLKGEATQEKFLSLLHNFIEGRKRILTYIMIGALGCYFISALLIYPFLLRAQGAREEVLSFFLRMPRDAITRLYERCEEYVRKKEEIENAEFKDDESIDKKPISTSSFEEEPGSSTKKREFLKATSTEWSLFWKVLFTMLLLDTYNVASEIFVSYVGDVIGKNVNILYENSNLDFMTILALLALREHAIGSGMKLFGHSDAQLAIDGVIDSVRIEIQDTLEVFFLIIVAKIG